MERLTPRFLEKIWGSAHLEPWFASRDASVVGGKVGEVWFEGSEPSPLLVKFIFTSEDLSVQVHPEGKTEMWHILAAQPGARIAAGFREPVSEGRLRAAAESGEIMDLLEWHAAAPGDTFFIPAGTVHAIGAGLVLCEIQQNSDVTYRLYDYGRPRELHLERGLAVSRRERFNARQPSSEVSCRYFVTKSLRVEGSAQVLTPREHFQLFIVIEGAGEMDGHPVRAGEVWRAAPDTLLSASGNLTMLVTAPAA